MKSYDALTFLFGYFLGSIPFGLILTRVAGGPDVRTIGSGNIGATNVLRTGRKGIAAATLVCDMLKGTAAVWVTTYYVSHQFAEVWADHAIDARYFYARYFTLFIAVYLAAIGAFLGHLFPVWLKFKGGKGVATYIGILLGIYWPGALIFCAIWLTVAALFRYSSLAALIASALTPLTLWILSPEAVILFFPLTLLLWMRHYANIARLLRGSEDKIGIKTIRPT